MGLISNWLEDRRNKKKYEYDLLKNLLKTNASDFTPEEVNQMVYSIGDKGQFEIPSQRKVPFVGPLSSEDQGLTDRAGGERPYQYEPIRLKAKGAQSPSPYTHFINGDTGEITEIPEELRGLLNIKNTIKTNPTNQPKSTGAENKSGQTFEEKKELEAQKQEFQIYKQKEQEKKEFRKEMRKILNDQESTNQQIKMASDALNILDQTDEVPVFSSEENKILGFIPFGSQTKVSARNAKENIVKADNEKSTSIPSFATIEEAENALKSKRIKKGQKVLIGGKEAIAN